MRMVPVELLERILLITRHLAPSISTEISAIIDGPGVEPVAPFAYTYEEDGETYFAHPQGHVPPEAKPLYLADPSAPVQAVPDVLFDGYAVLQALDAKAKGSTSPENVADVLDAVVRLLRAAPQPPKESTAQPSAVACPLVDDPEGRN